MSPRYLISGEIKLEKWKYRNITSLFDHSREYYDKLQHILSKFKNLYQLEIIKIQLKTYDTNKSYMDTKNGIINSYWEMINLKNREIEILSQF